MSDTRPLTIVLCHCGWSESQSWDKGESQLETWVLKFTVQAIHMLGAKAMSENLKMETEICPCPHLECEGWDCRKG